MKKFAKSVLGVTLLEIMLVLAIAAMIIVMSVRYYQSATANQQANAVLQMVQAITAAADSMAQGSGTYSQVTTDNIKPLMPQASLTAPWGGTIAISSGTTSYTVTIGAVPPAVCPLLRSRLGASAKYVITGSCDATKPAAFGYTYDNTK